MTISPPTARCARRARCGVSVLALLASCFLAACGASTSSSSPPKSFTHVHRYSGHGDTSVGTVQVPRFAEIFWHTGGGALHITSTPPLEIDRGGAANGVATVATASYSDVHIATRGNWTIEVRW